MSQNKIYTLGYTTTNPVELLKFVTDLDAFLLDIRFSPHSRAPQWNKDNLRDLVGRDRYFWIVALGNPNFRGGPIELHDYQTGQEQISRALALRNVILLCACANLETCHRRLAASLLGEHLQVEVEHLKGFKSKGVK